MTYSAIIEAEPSLVGYWKLDETSGTVAADSSTNSNNGTISGAPTMGANGLVFEPSGKCIDFDGVNDLITASNTSSDPSEITVELWMKSTDTTNVTVVYEHRTGPSGFLIQVLINAGAVRVAKYTSGTTYTTYDSATAVCDGEVHHLVLVMTKSSTKFYVDNVFIEEDTTVYAGNWSATTQTIGANNQNNNNYTGKMQHVAVYLSLLTPLQIRQHYQAGIAQGFHKEVLALNPTAYFPLNEASGDAIDWSGNDNNGTLTGGVTQGAVGALAYDDSTAYTFDGVDDGCVSDSQVADPSIITFAAKFKTTLTANGCVIGHRDSSNDLCYLYVLGSTGKVSFEFRSSGTAVQTLESISAVNDGDWHEVVAIMDKAGNHELFVDGVSNDTSTQVMSGTISSTLTTVGYMTDGTTPGGRFDGEIQCAAKFNSAPTAAQIRTLYQSGKTLIESRGYPKVIQNLAPSGYWRLGEASGTTAFDDSGNDNDGTINGSPVMATSNGALHQSRLKAMTFDGADDDVQTTYAGQTGSTARTLLAWVKPSSIAAVNPVAAYGTNTAADMFQLTVETDGKIKLDINGADAKGSTVLAINNYYLVCAVLTGTDVNSIDLYVNGAVETEVYTSGATVLTTASSVNMRIGNDIGGTLYFAGDISEVMEVNSALSAQQIKQIYEAGKSRYAAEVISYEPSNYYRHDEASGNAIDLGSLANDGVWTGSPSYEQASEVIANEPNNKSIAVTTSESLAFTSHAATTTYSLLSIIKPTGVAGSQAIFTDGTDSLKLNGSNLSLFYSATEHNSNTTLVAGEAHMVGVSVNAGAATFNLDGANDGTAASATSFAPTKLYDLTFAGTGDEAAVFGTDLTDEQYLDIYEMASFSIDQLTLFGIKGVLTESLTADQWIARTHKRDNGDFLDSYTWDGTGFYNVLTNQYEGAVDVTILQDIGLEWKPSVVTALGDRVYPTDAITNNFYFICTTAGTTGANEPVWPGSGTIVDGTVTWTWKGGLVRPKVHGPLKPILIA
jgi:hypothetical protein